MTTSSTMSAERQAELLASITEFNCDENAFGNVPTYWDAAGHLVSTFELTWDDALLLVLRWQTERREAELAVVPGKMNIAPVEIPGRLRQSPAILRWIRDARPRDLAKYRALYAGSAA